MKYLIVVLVIVVVGWLLLRERKPKAPAARAARAIDHGGAGCRMKARWESSDESSLMKAA